MLRQFLQRLSTWSSATTCARAGCMGGAIYFAHLPFTHRFSKSSPSHAWIDTSNGKRSNGKRSKRDRIYEYINKSRNNQRITPRPNHKGMNPSINEQVNEHINDKLKQSMNKSIYQKVAEHITEFASKKNKNL